MNVTKNSPDGWDYQYLASLYTFLLFSKTDNVTEAYIDNSGSGDLSLVIETDEKKAYEFEFKNRKPAFDEKYFVKCVSKFNPRSDREYILSNLSTGKVSGFYLVTSARAEQFADTFSLVASNPYWSKPKKTMIQKTIKAFRETVVKYNQKDESRDKFVVSHLIGLSLSELDELMGRITIVDQLDKENITSRINSLFTDLTIPWSKQASLISELLNVIKESKTTGINIANNLKSRIDSLKSWPIPVCEPYIPFGDEKALFDELSRYKVLLLTGTALCGKTEKARYLAAQLMCDYPAAQFKVTGDIHVAEQFLLNYEAEARICYLEDPLGQYRDDKSKTVYKQLEAFIKQIPKNRDRYLIVTATTEITTAMGKSGYMNEFDWHDLTVRNIEKSFEVWRSLCSGKGINSIVNKIVIEAIRAGEASDVMQPGQLRQLVASLRTEHPKSIEEVKHLASAKSQDIKETITKKSQDIINLMVILGLCATIQDGIAPLELSYLEHSATDYLPGINIHETDATGTSLFGSFKKVYTLPDYIPLNSASAMLDTLSQLIDLGYIRSTSNGTYLFAHPIYQEAARRLITGENPRRFDLAILHCRKLLGCLDPLLALQSAKNLYLLYRNAATDEQRKQVLQLGWLATACTFVVVREEALFFLVSHFDQLGNELAEDVRKAFRHRINFGTENYCWQGQVLFIPDEKHLTLDSDRTYKSKNTYLKEWQKYVLSPTFLDPKTAYDLLGGLLKASKSERKQLSFDRENLKVFLRYKEGGIRERAAYLFAASITEQTFEELSSLYFENDPFVKFQLIRGLFRSWPYLLDNTKKQEILAFMTSTFDEPFVVMGAIRLFTEFAAGYASSSFDWMYEIEPSAKKKMWYVWGELMVVFFQHLPTDVHVNSGRFTGTLQEAQITREAKIKIVIAYFNWLTGYFGDFNRYWDMAEIFLSYFGDNFTILPKLKRIALIGQLLEMPDENFVAQAVSLLLSGWDQLTAKEKKIVLDRLPNLSKKAKLAAFTADNAPGDVQFAALGHRLGHTTEATVATIPGALLREVLSAVYIEFPVRGMSNLNLAVFDPLLYYYVDKPNERAFSVAIQVFVEDIFSWGRDRRGLWREPHAIIAAIRDSEIPEAFTFTSSLLLQSLMDERASAAGPYLDLLYEGASSAMQTALNDKVFLNLESISQNENLKSVSKYITKSDYDTLVADKAVIALSNLPPAEEDNDPVAKGLAQFILLALDHKKIRLHNLLLYFRNWADDNSDQMEEGYSEKINDYFSYLHTIAQSQRDEMEQEIARLSSSYLYN